MKLSYKLLLGLLLIAYSACSESPSEKGSVQYISEIKSFHQKRINNLKKENGWLNLIGLFWLNEGSNSFGASDTCDIVFPGSICPPYIGKFILKDSVVNVVIDPSIEVINNEKKVDKLEMRNDLEGDPTILSYKSLRWYVIKRGNKIGIRLRYIDAPLVKNFTDIETYPINEDWKFNADFKTYDPPKLISVPNILGQIDKEKSPGALVFEKDGKEYRLDAIDEGDSFFIIFADETSGKETYGGGRFLYTGKPDSTGRVILDFNKAYNPPCVFTKYATCPLPPRQNYLKLNITAGEKAYGHNH